MNEIFLVGRSQNTNQKTVLNVNDDGTLSTVPKKNLLTFQLLNNLLVPGFSNFVSGSIDVSQYNKMSFLGISTNFNDPVNFEVSYDNVNFYKWSFNSIYPDFETGALTTVFEDLPFNYLKVNITNNQGDDHTYTLEYALSK